MPNVPSFSLRAGPAAPRAPTMRPGRSAKIASKLASTYPHTDGIFSTSGGKSQNRERPTTRLPAPTANSVSVVFGVSETTLVALFFNVDGVSRLRQADLQRT